MTGPLPDPHRSAPPVPDTPVPDAPQLDAPQLDALLPAVSPADGAALAGLAAAAIAAELAGLSPEASPPPAPSLWERGATFITLTRDGELRGCVGSLEPVRPRHQDVVRNAVRALADPRFPPVTAAEQPALAVCVSVLSPMDDLPADDRAALLAALRPALDGLVLAADGRRATFLPRVWAQLPTREAFVDALLAKGGWPDSGWPEGLTARRYTAAEFTLPPGRTAAVHS